MVGCPADLRADAERIWRAGVAAVAPERLIREHVVVDGNRLHVGDETMDMRSIERIAIVGAGKAAGAMAAALETALGPRLLAEKQVTGWVNVPADCVTPTVRVRLHAGRPAGVNEPRPEGVAGTQRILELVASLQPNDLCLCVLAGGGSALMPSPIAGISLHDKVAVTRLLAAAGANIEQLNTIRRELSLIKGGGLARACRAGRLVSLILSDVLGDPLHMIASGPTVVTEPATTEALTVLEQFRLLNAPAMASVVRYLRKKQLRQHEEGPGPVASDRRTGLQECVITNLVIGNNATAVDAAGIEAVRLGYSPAMISANGPEGLAEDTGRHLAELAIRMHRESGPDCLVSGGEPTVALIEESRRGKGGRNQQLALSAFMELGDCTGIALLSGGTDGEDGPTNAAGAFVTADVVRAARGRQLDPRDYLSRDDAYHFFESAGGLFLTGPTHTNVCDLRIVVVDRE